MSDLQLTINDIILRATKQTLEDYAIEHPNLAEAISRIDIDTTIVEKLRSTPEYKEAEEKYVQARIEIDFFNNVVSLLKTLLPLLIAL
jgi:hypothetical protein